MRITFLSGLFTRAKQSAGLRDVALGQVATSRTSGSPREASPSVQRLACGSAILALLSCMPGCNPVAVPVEPLSLPRTSEESRILELVQANNRFAWVLHRRQGSSKNLALAPFPILLDLRTVAAGAQGETLAELEQAMGVPASVEDLDYAALRELLFGAERPASLDEEEEPVGGQYALGIAASVWADDTLEIAPRYEARVRSITGTGLHRTDLRDSKTLRTSLNDWIRAATEGSTQQLEPPEQLSQGAGLVGVCALHLRGAWLDSFAIEDTQEADFHSSPDVDQRVMMMKNVGSYRFVETDQEQAVLLSCYGGMDVLFVLPKSLDGLASLEKRTDQAFVEQLLSELILQPGVVQVPRFKVQTALDLKATLTDLGVRAAFDLRAADFSQVTSSPLSLGAVQQVSFLNVDEEGITAGASSFHGRFGGKGGRTPFEFVADHPFLFVVLHRSTGMVLITGRFSEPGGGR